MILTTLAFSTKNIISLDLNRSREHIIYYAVEEVDWNPKGKDGKVNAKQLKDGLAL